ncbi:MAG: hypothetical protein QNK63_02795 [Flavobacteriales bacterium]
MDENRNCSTNDDNLASDIDWIKIKKLYLGLEKEVSSTNNSGYMFIKKKEVDYMTSSEEMISTLVSKINSGGYFILIKSLYQGLGEEDF